MLKKITTLAVFASALSLSVSAYATTLSGRIHSVSPTSIAVFDKEIVTVAMNGDTRFTKIVGAKPWQTDIALTFNALVPGRYVVVHVEKGVATWVQVDLNTPIASSTALRVPVPAFTASDSKRPGSVDTAAYCERKASRLSKAAAPAAGVASSPASTAPLKESEMHRAEARALRANPNASESKRPGAPGTAVHCDRLADQLEKEGR